MRLFRTKASARAGSVSYRSPTRARKHKEAAAVPLTTVLRNTLCPRHPTSRRTSRLRLVFRIRPRLPSRTETTISSRSAALDTIAPLRPAGATARQTQTGSTAGTARQRHAAAGTAALPPGNGGTALRARALPARRGLSAGRCGDVTSGARLCRKVARRTRSFRRASLKAERWPAGRLLEQGGLRLRSLRIVRLAWQLLSCENCFLVDWFPRSYGRSRSVKLPTFVAEMQQSAAKAVFRHCTYLWLLKLL